MDGIINDQTSIVLTCLISAIILSANVNSYKTGPPNKPLVCKDMFPIGHGVDSQFDEPPYKISLSKNVYNEGYEEFRVTVRALHGFYIGGLFIQARRARNCNTDEQKMPVGVFKLLPGERHLKLMSCNNRLNSSLSHKSFTPLDSAVFRWFAPAHPIGHIYLVATVVKEKTKFWTTVYSEIIRDQTSSLQPDRCEAKIFLDPETKYTTPLPTGKTEKQCADAAGLSTNILILAVTLLASYL